MPRLALAALLAALVASASARAAGGAPCWTLALRELQERGTPALDIGIADRPTPDAIRATFDSATHDLRIHAGNGVSDERAQQVLAFFDAAWAMQVEGAGFAPPLADGDAGGDARFDVYVVPLAPGLAGVTVAEADADAADGRHASPAFIQLDANLEDGLLEVFAHHEFQHALQFAIDTRETIMWLEASAVFWEVRANPAVDDWTGSLPDFQGSPQLPIFVDGADAEALSPRPAARYEYGAVLFALYLDEVHGDGAGTLLRQIWDGAPQPDAVEENEPDFLDAMAAAGVDPGEAVADFVGWRALVGPFAVEDDGPREDVPADSLLFALQLDAATLDGDEELTDAQDGPYPLGCAVRQVRAPQNVDVMPVDIRASPTLEGQDLRLALLVTEDGLAAPVLRTQSAALEASVDVPRGHLLQVAVCDVSAVDPDDDVDVRPVRLSILRTDVEFPDAGPPPPEDAGVVADAGVEVPPPPPMCGCQSTPRAPDGRRAPSQGGADQAQKTKLVFSLFAMGATLIALTVRGVRHKRRGTTMKPTKKRDP